MTDDEAAVALKQLTEHYKQPVLPLSAFCAALETWAYAISDNVRRPNAPYDSCTDRHGAAYAALLSRITIDIHKSALLVRLIYRGEKLRTARCPTHGGHLEMLEWLGDPAHPRCTHGCGGTGWLPNL